MGSFVAMAAMAAIGALVFAGAVRAEQHPVVVELYTSQGCSSCPPADRLLQRLAERDGVIALALHVDYWDYIGWADGYARPEHTARQKAYARSAGETMVYTPQMIIGGADRVVGARVMDVMDAVDAHASRRPPVEMQVRRTGDVLEVSADAVAQAEARLAAAGPFVVQLVRYLPEGTVRILRGENAGHSFTYANIVTQWSVVSEWDGTGPLSLVLEVSGEEPAVVIVQQKGYGAIVGAAAAR